MTLEQRLNVLEKRLDGYIKNQNIKAKYDSYDKDGLRHTDSLNAEGIAETKDELVASEEGLCDVDMSYDARVADVEEALCELTEMLNL